MSEFDPTPFNVALRAIREAVKEFDAVHQFAVISAALCAKALENGLSREQVLAGLDGTYAILHTEQRQKLTASQTGLTS